MNYRDVTCPNCGTVYGVGYSDVPHCVENIHREGLILTTDTLNESMVRFYPDDM